MLNRTRLLLGALLGAAGLVLSLLAATGPTASAAPASARSSALGTSGALGVQRAAGDRFAVAERRRIGRSVRGRPIFAYRLGDPPGRGVRTVMLISTMHGDEPATRAILNSLRDGRPIRGISMWIVPDYNPDGLARRTRKNARGVDLNRNYPNNWRNLDGKTESGSGPASEPETRAMINFLRTIRPSRILSFHQPLYGVDVNTKRPRFARRVASSLQLPKDSFDCGGRCYGTMTSWYNNNFKGNALTVEYGYRPSRRYLRTVVPGQILRLFGARFGDAKHEFVASCC